jgi:hypothetical protein
MLLLLCITQLRSDIVYKTLPIHGDIPFEEQLEAFKPAAAGEIKVSASL